MAEMSYAMVSTWVCMKTYGEIAYVPYALLEIIFQIDLKIPINYFLK